MKKFIRILTSSLLIAAMLVTALPEAVFAGSSSSKEPDRTYSGGVYQTGGITNKWPSGYSNTNPKTYILVVNTGGLAGSCVQNVVLKYYTDPDNANKDKFAVASLCPTREQIYVEDRYDSYYNPPMPSLGNGAIANFANARWAFEGSKYNSLIPILECSTFKDASGNLHVLPFTKYGEWAKSISGADGFPTAVEKTNTTLFSSNSVETIRFRLEYPLYQLKELSFVCTSSGDWQMLDWEIYQVDEFDMSKTEYSWKGNTTLNNFAFASNKIEPAFDGKLIYQSTATTNQKIRESQAGSLASVDGAQFTFYNKSLLPKATCNLEKETTTDPRYMSSNDGQLLMLCFESCYSMRSKSQSHKILNFAINLEDAYGAGVEMFQRNPETGEFPLTDMLTAEIDYIDAEGHEALVNVPVFANALLEYAVPMSGDIEDDLTRYDMVVTTVEGEGEEAKYYRKTESFAQQGESICFSMEFASFGSLKSVKLKFLNPYDDEDSISIRSIGVYDNWGDQTTPRRDYYRDYGNGIAVIQGIETAGYHKSNLLYATTLPSSVTLDNYTAEYEFKLSDNKPSIAQRNWEDYYLVSLTTDSMDLASTQAELFLQLEYKDTQNADKHTAELSLKDASKDYYGYTMSVHSADVPVTDEFGNPVWNDNGTQKTDRQSEIVDGAYYYNVQAGKTLNYLVHVANVSKFTNAKFRIENINDEWQLYGMKITKVSDVGRRNIVSLGNAYGFGTPDSHYSMSHIYERQVTGEVKYERDNIALYLNAGSTADLDLTKNNKGDVHEEENNHYHDIKEMPFALANTDLHLDEVAKNYEIRVHVASNNASATNTDNCGSQNLYYFQLVFKDGSKSAMVLANQQLSSDNFRSGQTEIFNISANRDMGDIVGINIIPDDVTTDSNPLDKLCITSIDIIKQNKTTANKRFVVDNVGWIAMNYKDTDDSTERVGRMASELTQYFPITYSSYMLELEFSIAIGQYGKDFPQFVGNMTADLWYINTDGKEVSISDIQVVQKMYEYQGGVPQMDKYQNYMSDSNTMFRAGTIDRFTVDIESCTMLERIVLHGNPLQNTSLPITDVSVRVYQGKGTRRLVQYANKVSGYEMAFNEGQEPIFLCDLRATPTKAFDFGTDGKSFANLIFDEAELPEFDEEITFDVIPTREPSSSNDMINVYLYLEPGVPAPADGDYELTAEVSYVAGSTTDIFTNRIASQSFRTATATNDAGQSQVVLFVEGRDAHSMSSLQNIYLSSNRITRNDLRVDYAMVQQVRDGVVINTYKVGFASKCFGSKTGASSMLFQEKSENKSRQKVSILVADGSSNAKLTQASHDLAVAIQYTTKAIGNNVYTSPYVFATDSGADHIHAGALMTFEFSEVDVSAITGIKVMGSGGVMVSMNGANAVTYEPDANGELSETGWYSFDTDILIGSDPTVINTSSTKKDSVYALKRADFTFKTTEVSPVIDSAGKYPIRARITYSQKDTGTSVLDVPDIRKCVTSNYGSGFTAGEESTISVFLPGLEEIYSIELEPYNDYEKIVASWNLDYIKYKAEGIEDTSEHTVPVGKTIYEDNALSLNLSSIFIDMSVESNGIIYRVVNDTLDIVVENGTVLTITPIIYQSDEGYKIHVYRVIGGAIELVADYGTDFPSFEYTATNSSGDTEIYRVVVESIQNSAVQSTVNISIPATKQ